MKKNLLFLFACVCSLLFSACSQEAQTGTDLPKYELQTLSPQTRTINYTYPATLKGKNDTDVYPQASGRIISVNYVNGGIVKKGDVLFNIDPTTYALEVQTQQGRVSAAKAALSTAQLEYNSQKNLFDKNIVSAYALELAQNNYQSAQAQYEQAKAALSIAQTNLGYCRVTAPVSGIVKGHVDQVGTLVSPSMPQPVATVSEQSTIKAAFSLTEEVYLNIVKKTHIENTKDGVIGENGKNASEIFPNIGLQLKDGSLYSEKGKISFISGIIDRATGSIACEVLFANPDNLLHSGNTASIIFPVEVNDVLIVPQTACKKLQDKYLVYRVNAEGCAEGIVTDVTPTDDGKEYIIESGLNAGDEIVANGVSRIAEGQKIK